MTSHSFAQAEQLSREAFELCLAHDVYHAQELLLRAHSDLKRLSGDLPIVGYASDFEEEHEASFVTHTFEEACAWGWFELVSGVFQLVQDHAGTGVVHFRRAWRIWRPWGMQREQPEIARTATLERIRVGFWLGEGWARYMSDRAEQTARATTRAALIEHTREAAPHILQETLMHQFKLPPAQLGTPAYQASGKTHPYVCLLMSENDSTDFYIV
jgi:hypothetical protein